MISERHKNTVINKLIMIQTNSVKVALPFFITLPFLDL